MNVNLNKDQIEIEKFDALAADWWNPEGSMKPLHQLNPVRLQYVLNQTAVDGLKVLDVGCGAGLLTEALAMQGADIYGIDLSTSVIQVAQQHAKNNELNIKYANQPIETFAKSHTEFFDVITCMELLEHVPDPVDFIKRCASLLKPGGIIIFSTINRTLKAYTVAILGAEYILNILPRGTHEYAKFIRPSELRRWAGTAGLVFNHLQGLRYQPLTQKFILCEDVAVNYLMTCHKPTDEKNN